MVSSYYHPGAVDSRGPDIWLAVHTESNLASSDGECGVSQNSQRVPELRRPIRLSDFGQGWRDPLHILSPSFGRAP